MSATRTHISAAGNTLPGALAVLRPNAPIAYWLPTTRSLCSA
jgi:hypothetical protein